MNRNDRIADQMAELAEIERRLDPEPRRKGRVIADLITVTILAPVAIALDWHATRPLLLLGLMAAALVANRLIPTVSERLLRRDRERLLLELGQDGP